MALKRRSQGIAFSTIVTGALALLVLFIVGFIFLNWMRSASQSTPKEIDNFKRNCNMWCSDLRSMVQLSELNAIDVDDVKSHLYCTRYIDTSRLGGSVMDHCWDDEGNDLVRISCTASIIVDSSNGKKCIKNRKLICPIRNLKEMSRLCNCTATITFCNSTPATGNSAVGYIQCGNYYNISEGVRCIILGGG